MWKVGSGPPPAALTAPELEFAFSLLSTERGDATATYLAGLPDAGSSILESVQDLFHDSLGQRFTEADRFDPANKPPLQYLRDACLVFFQELGPRAKVVAPDLLELLRRREAEGEFVGSSSGRFFGNVLRSVLAESPDVITSASRSPVVGVRVEMCRVMGYFKAARATFGPVLFEMLEDEDDKVVDVAINALGDLKWSDAKVVERLRARMTRLKTPRMREPWQVGLRYLEKIAEK